MVQSVSWEANRSPSSG